VQFIDQSAEANYRSARDSDACAGHGASIPPPALPTPDRAARTNHPRRVIRPRPRAHTVAAVGDAIGQVLSLGVAVALSPVPIIAVVLMLGTPRASANGAAFVLGWVVGLAVVGTFVLVAASGADASEDGEPATWVGVLKLVLGALLVLVALRQWRGRPREGDEAELPKWMQTIDTFSPGKALAMGILFSGVNPKNLILTVAAASAIAQTGIDTGEQAVALAVFVVIGTLGPGLPVAMYFALGARARHVLDELKAWMAGHNAAIMAVLCLVIGAKLIGDGISGLS
jgi:threonine/homoserine/homoserine lactone efflux protein